MKSAELSSDLGWTFRWRDPVLMWLCAASLIVRALVIWRFPGPAHPDETFQYLEQAHRLLYGSGFVPWEYVVGARSWFFPGILAGVMWLFGPPWFAPDVAVLAADGFMAMLWVPVVVAAYRWGGIAAGRAGAVTAGAAVAFWFETLFFSIHPLIDTFATDLFVLGIALLYPNILSHRCRFWGGLVLGIVVVIRVQLVLPVFLCVAIEHGLRLAPQRRAGWWVMLAGIVSGAIALGGLDALTWGMPYQSIIQILWYDIAQKMTTVFGVEPWYYYIGLESYYTYAIAGPLVILSFYGARRLPLLGLIAIVIGVSFSCIDHKEERYILPLLPFFLVLAAIGSVMAVQGGLSFIRVSQPVAARVCPALWIGLSLLLGAGGGFSWHWAATNGLVHAMRIIQADPAACGLGVYTPRPYDAVSSGYTYLRPGMNLVPLSHESQALQEEAYNYLLVVHFPDGPAEPPLPMFSSAFQRQKCWDNTAVSFCLWHRDGECPVRTPRIIHDRLMRFVAPFQWRLLLPARWRGQAVP